MLRIRKFDLPRPRISSHGDSWSRTAACESSFISQLFSTSTPLVPLSVHTKPTPTVLDYVIKRRIAIREKPSRQVYLSLLSGHKTWHPNDIRCNSHPLPGMDQTFIQYTSSLSTKVSSLPHHYALRVKISMFSSSAAVQAFQPHNSRLLSQASMLQRMMYLALSSPSPRRICPRTKLYSFKATWWPRISP